MAETAESIVKASHGFIRILNSEVDLTDTEFSDGARDLNRVMAMIENFFPLRYTPVSKRDDVITSPEWSILFMITILGSYISIQYGTVLDGNQVATAKAAYNAVLGRVKRAPRSRLQPSTPMGGGYGGCGGAWGRSNFAGNPTYDDLLTGTGANLLDSPSGANLTQNIHDSHD